jgi:hypothetical protein
MNLLCGYRVALSRTSLSELFLKYTLSNDKRQLMISVNFFYKKHSSVGWTLLRTLMKSSKIARIVSV